MKILHFSILALYFISVVFASQNEIDSTSNQNETEKNAQFTNPSQNFSPKVLLEKLAVSKVFSTFMFPVYYIKMKLKMRKCPPLTIDKFNELLELMEFDTVLEKTIFLQENVDQNDKSTGKGIFAVLKASEQIDNADLLDANQDVFKKYQKNFLSEKHGTIWIPYKQSPVKTQNNTFDYVMIEYKRNYKNEKYTVPVLYFKTVQKNFNSNITSKIQILCRFFSKSDITIVYKSYSENLPSEFQKDRFFVIFLLAFKNNIDVRCKSWTAIYRAALYLMECGF